MKVEKILDGFVEYSDFLDNVLIGKTKDGYLTFIQKDDYTIINENVLNDKIVKIRKLTDSDLVECKDVNGYITLRRSSNFLAKLLVPWIIKKLLVSPQCQENITWLQKVKMVIFT